MALRGLISIAVRAYGVCFPLRYVLVFVFAFKFVLILVFVFKSVR